MADNYSVRVNEDTMERFREYVKRADTTQNDFLSMLLTFYAAKEVSDQLPIMDTAVKAIRAQTETITKIVIGVGESLVLEQKQANEQLEAKELEMDQRTADAQAERDTAKNTLEDFQKEFDKKVAELADSTERGKQLESTLDDKINIVNSQKEKIDALETVIAGQRKDIQDAKMALAENSDLREKLREQDLRIQQAEADKKVLEAEKKAIEADKKAVEAELTKADAEKTQAFNELETALRQEMNEQQTKRELAFKNYEERTNAYMEREGRLNDQIRDLQTQINDQRAQIDAFILKDQQEKPPVKTKAQKDKGGEGPMEP